MNPYTLVIIDMQKGFLAARDVSVQKSVEKEIKTAIDLGNPIVVLELISIYNGEPDYIYGKTYKFITNYTNIYDRMFITYKTICSGFLQIDKLLNDGDVYSNKFRICGVNTDQCVEETVTDLHKNYMESVIEVVKSGCNYYVGEDLDSLKDSYDPYVAYPRSERIKYV